MAVQAQSDTTEVRDTMGATNVLTAAASPPAAGRNGAANAGGAAVAAGAAPKKGCKTKKVTMNARKFGAGVTGAAAKEAAGEAETRAGAMVESPSHKQRMTESDAVTPSAGKKAAANKPRRSESTKKKVAKTPRRSPAGEKSSGGPASPSRTLSDILPRQSTSAVPSNTTTVQAWSNTTEFRHTTGGDDVPTAVAIPPPAGRHGAANAGGAAVGAGAAPRKGGKTKKVTMNARKFKAGVTGAAATKTAGEAETRAGATFESSNGKKRVLESDAGTPSSGVSADKRAAVNKPRRSASTKENVAKTPRRSLAGNRPPGGLASPSRTASAARPRGRPPAAGRNGAANAGGAAVGA
ncbi:unnamed protein product, partial [Sphacelaria rigidula]